MGALALLLVMQDAMFLPHPQEPPYWLSGQANFILQAHPSFDAPYTGPNSLQRFSETAVSGVITVYTGFELCRTTELLFDGESAQGGGISTALGLAGFTNLDVVRNPELGPEPYIARLELHQVIPLSSNWVPNVRTPLSTLRELPERRIDIYLGKMSTVEFFDLSGVVGDSHQQFMNWAIDNNGAFDYAADTRGYTYGLAVDYQSPSLIARFGVMTMPKVANGIEFDFDYANARAENFEVDWLYKTGIVRTLAYINHANMGLYRDAIASPDHEITETRKPGRIKYGFGASVEQAIGNYVRAFVRFGWNDGTTESFAYTEVDNSFLVAAQVSGTLWRRNGDTAAASFVSNGISDEHRDYLAVGGSGFLLGDGFLTYGRETIVEAYYNAHVWRGFFAAADLQFIDNPGYNQDRGPVWVLSLRTHFDF